MVSEISKDGPMHHRRTRAITKEPLGQTLGPKLEKTDGQSLGYIKTDH